MSERINRQVLLAARPHGEPKESDFRLVETPVPEPGPGQILVRTLYLSLDPYMRGRMNAGPSYAPPIEIGQVMRGETVSRVEVSHVSQFQPGDVVDAYTG
jgi:NADPH-dependent curcumin reductase